MTENTKHEAKTVRREPDDDGRPFWAVCTCDWEAGPYGTWPTSDIVAATHVKEQSA